MPVLHLVIPFLNEQATLETVIGRVEQVGVAGRLDGPGDPGRRWLLRRRGRDLRGCTAAIGIPDLELSPSRVQPRQGRGAPNRLLADVLEHADEADLVGVQDADLEYAPSDLVRLRRDVRAARSTPIDAIVGNRWLGAQPNAIRRAHRIANGCLTVISNRLTGLKIHDMECCYKIIRVPMLRRILPDLDENHFAVEPQIAATLARHDARVREVGVSYDPRSFAEGKKIGLKDGLEAMTSMIREWRRSRHHRRSDPK